MVLEICANSYQSAKNAHIAGAHRIELCSELSVGGITPSYGLLKKVLAELSIETFVLLRPRSGNFCYTDVEFDILKRDLMNCKELGCHGIVSGVLKDSHTIDIERTAQLVHLAQPLPFTFHRAFDVVPNPEQSLLQLIELGVDRVLTSGQQPKAIDGIEQLKNLQRLAKDQITILPGSGINASNAPVFKSNGFREIHTSASEIVTSDTSAYFGAIPQSVSSIPIITNILKVLNDDI